MPHTLLISDLHLCTRQPDCAQAFLHFMQHTAPGAEALYILGDLFELWVGDDDLDDPFHQEVIRAMRTLTAGGTRLYVMHGNRDFLMGKALEQACGATLLKDPVLVNLYGKSTLLSHGDILCTDDAAYQAWRKQARESGWQQLFLTQPLAQRKSQSEQLREQSEQAKQVKSSAIMDVNAEAVAALLREYGYPRLIHGHTHRAGRSLHHVDGHSCERWVLGDWDGGKPNALRCDVRGCGWVEVAG